MNTTEHGLPVSSFHLSFSFDLKCAGHSFLRRLVYYCCRLCMHVHKRTNIYTHNNKKRNPVT